MMIDPMERWREFGDRPDYAGLPTYAGMPYVQDPAALASVDVAIVGAPTDDFVSDRPGTRFGPRGIREASDSPGPHMDAGVNAFDELRVIDFGDAPVLPANLPKTHEAIECTVGVVVAAGALPVVLGGDHSITEPDVREPLSNLDAKLRVQMRVEIRALQQQVGVTTLYVTHDQVEAMTLGDLVAVMKDGELQQVAPPEELYRYPHNRFVAGFMGSPAMNFARADVALDGDRLQLRFGDQVLSLPSDFVRRRPDLRRYSGKSIVLGVRPEGFQATTRQPEPHDDLTMAVRVEMREALGADNVLHFSISDQESSATAGTETATAGLDLEVSRYWVATVPGRSDIRERDIVCLHPNLDEIRFFDPTGGQAVGSVAS